MTASTGTITVEVLVNDEDVTKVSFEVVGVSSVCRRITAHRSWSIRFDKKFKTLSRDDTQGCLQALFSRV